MYLAILTSWISDQYINYVQEHIRNILVKSTSSFNLTLVSVKIKFCALKLCPAMAAILGFLMNQRINFVRFRVMLSCVNHHLNITTHIKKKFVKNYQMIIHTQFGLNCYRA